MAAHLVWLSLDLRVQCHEITFVVYLNPINKKRPDSSLTQATPDQSFPHPSYSSSTYELVHAKRVLEKAL